jgi:hypothetical protein
VRGKKKYREVENDKRKREISKEAKRKKCK